MPVAATLLLRQVTGNHLRREAVVGQGQLLLVVVIRNVGSDSAIADGPHHAMRHHLEGSGIAPRTTVEMDRL